MAKMTNLLERWEEDETGALPASLELVTLNADETPLLFFTPEGMEAELHYLSLDELRGYIQCNGKDCLLCRAGYKLDKRFLFPVYSLDAGAVAVLPVSPNIRPGALKPQLMPILRSTTPQVALIRKPDRTRFEVNVVPLQPGIDDGREAIKAFLARVEANEIDLMSVFPKYDNATLADISLIRNKLILKGVDVMQNQGGSEQQ